MSADSQIPISSWLGILLNFLFWILCEDTEFFLTGCYTHRCSDCGLKWEKELFTVSPTQRFDTPLSTDIFFFSHSYVIRYSVANCAAPKCAQISKRTSEPSEYRMKEVGERENARVCGIAENKNIAVFAIYRENQRVRHTHTHSVRERLLWLQFFFSFVRCNEFNEIIIWYHWENDTNGFPFHFNWKMYLLFTEFLQRRTWSNRKFNGKTIFKRITQSPHRIVISFYILNMLWIKMLDTFH